MRSDGQKSLRYYFAREKQTTVSLPSERSSLNSPSGSKRSLSDDDAEPLSSTPAKKKPSAAKSVIVIDSDIDEDEENVFKRSTKYRNWKFVCSPSEKNILQDQSSQRLTAGSCKKKITRSRPGKWSCAACTYSNHPLISYCEMCSTRRDSQHTQPTCSLTESSAVVCPDLVAGSLSEACSSSPGSCEGVSGLPLYQQNSSNCLSGSSQENRTHGNAVSTMSRINELSNCVSPTSAVCNRSLLRKLSIDSEEPVDDNSVSNSQMDKSLVTDVNTQSSSVFSIDFSNMTVHELFQYSCSRNSSRIYVCDKVLAF